MLLRHLEHGIWIRSAIVCHHNDTIVFLTMNIQIRSVHLSDNDPFLSLKSLLLGSAMSQARTFTS